MRNHFLARAGLATLLLLTLAACGRQSTGISGTITSPTGNVTGTIVAACASNACDPEADGSGGFQITSSGASATYTIPVTSGQYAVIALQDTNGDGQPSVGDYGGVYPEAVTAPSSGIDITLQPLTASSSLNSSPLKDAGERFLKR